MFNDKKKFSALILLFAVFLGILSCKGTPEQIKSGDLVIRMEPGEEWLHQFSFMIKNPPQFVLWTEDKEGHYLHTLYATRKVATQGWVMNKGNRRLEALPYWEHQRDVSDEKGFLLPSKKHPLADSVTGATPRKGVEIRCSPESVINGFYLFLEVNHSTDFNNAWPADAVITDNNWTGGEGGSGQPSLVYSLWIDGKNPGTRNMRLAGHGSPDGSDGGVYDDLSSLTTSLDIIQNITVTVIP